MIKHILKKFFLETPYKRRYSYTYDHYLYEHMHAHPTSMNTFKRLSWLDIETHEVGHQERLAVDGDAASQ
jgi:hypothetical protein